MPLQWVGSASGAGLGFILANIPGAIGGAVVGNRIGAIRDAKGKSVGAVFMNLSAGDRAAVLVSGPVKLVGDQLDKRFISIMTSSCAASRILTATTLFPCSALIESTCSQGPRLSGMISNGLPVDMPTLGRAILPSQTPSKAA